MPDSPNDPNNSDDIVAAAFASYRAAAPEHFSPLPAASLLTRAGAMKPRRRRVLTVSLAALGCTVFMVAGVAVAHSVVSSSPDKVGADGASSSDDTTSSKDDSEPDKSSKASPNQDSGPEPFEQGLDTKKIALPDWPGDKAADCPAGKYLFADNGDGDVVPSDGADGSEEPSKLDAAGDWQLMPNDAPAINTQLDDDSDDVIVPVACGDANGVVALSGNTDSYDTVGFVYAATKPSGPVTVDKVDGPNVTLNVGDVQGESTKKRQFTYSDGKFDETEPGDDPSEGEPSSPSDDPKTLPSDDPTPDDPGSSDDGHESDPKPSGDSDSD